MRETTSSGFPVATITLLILLSFAVMARAAHDLWAATLVHLAALVLIPALLTESRRSGNAGAVFPVASPMAVFLLCLVPSVVFAAQPASARLAFLDWTAFGVTFLVATNAFQPDARLLWLLTVVAALLCGQLLTGLIDALPGQGPSEMAGTLLNANALAGFVLLWLPAIFHQFRQGDAARRRVAGVGLAAAVATLAMAQSAWAWLCLSAFVWLSMARQKGRWVGIARAAAVLLVLGLAGYKLMRPASQNQSGVVILRTSDRVNWWKTAIRMGQAEPLHGIGLGGFAGGYVAYEAGPGQNTRFAHSLPLSLLAEAGVLGLLGFLSFVLVWWWRTRTASGIRAAFRSGATLFLAFTLASVGHEYLANLFALALAMGLAVDIRREPRIRPRLSLVVLAAGLVILAVPYLVSPWLASVNVMDGSRLMKAGEFEEADERYRAATELDPALSDAYHGRARVAWSQDRPDQAIDFLTKAIERDRLNGRLWQELCTALRQTGAPVQNGACVEARRLTGRARKVSGDAGESGNGSTETEAR